MQHIKVPVALVQATLMGLSTHPAVAAFQQLQTIPVQDDAPVPPEPEAAAKPADPEPAPEPAVAKPSKPKT